MKNRVEKYDGLKRAFVERYSEKELEDKYNKYILDLIVKLRSLYEDNYLILKRESVKHPKTQDYKKAWRREHVLNCLSKQLKSAIGMYMKEGNKCGKRALKG